MYCIVFVTCPNNKVANKIANILLKKKLAACINILPKIESMYWWEGKIEKSNESLMIIKTKSGLLKKVENEIKKIHPYEVPEVISIKIDRGSEKYLNWIKRVTK